ncbi:KEX2 [[Candida] subhashii]|uniref:KEX2 n=1 Tax=[Candida] subhashii TaxID=561895 RepID=A0A8J5US72_9ASCO|nr:KEX2 [[Candida] subhashii]KAG7666121.1 KEX2 [[Candida] subhashii]
MLPIRILSLVLGYLISFSYQQQVIPKRNYESNNYFLVEIDTSNSSKPLNDFINKYKDHYKFEHQLSSLDNYYVFSIDKSHPHNSFLGNLNSEQRNLMKRQDGFEDHYDHFITTPELKSIHMLPPKRLSKRLPVPIDPEEIVPYSNKRDDSNGVAATDEAVQRLAQVQEHFSISDPEFASQWHIINTQYPGNDVNVTGLWYEDILGQNIVTAIIDDGLDAQGEDLAENFNAKGSWDFNDNSPVPLPRLGDDYHGTRCAGEIAAVKNDVCGVGVAYKSQVSGIRILSGPITSADEASAMIYGLDTNDIYSCSWGPTDNGRTLAEPDLIVKEAMVKGVIDGRNKKGAVYVFASGNGGRSGDSCNFDGYTNSIYSITVGAVDYKGLHPAYAEACSAVMVVTYSSGSGEHIHTTDIKKKCSASHGGTSAAAPLASGLYSLMLSANPELTWRDVQYVSVLSASPINENDGNYQITALNRKYSHKYGYGKIDAYKMVHFAKEWKNVKPQAWYYSDVIPVHDKIVSTKASDEDKIIQSKISISEDDLKIMNLERVEHVTVKVNINSSYRGRVGMRLISPHGVISDLATFRPADSDGSGFQNWTFMSVAHWGETGIGDWTAEVFADDSRGDKTSIEFVDWQLKLFGESIETDKASRFDLKTDYAAVRRELQAAQKKPEESAAPTTTSTTSTKAEKDSTRVASSSATPGSSSLSSTDTSAEPSTSTEPTGGEDDGQNKQYVAEHTGQYFMALAVVGFIIVILIIKFHKTPGSSRRRRRDDYEFDIIPGEDYSDTEDDIDSLELGRYGNSRNQRRNDDDADDDEARDRLFDEFNAETLPDYDDAMFRIDDEDEHDEEDRNDAGKKKAKVDQKVRFDGNNQSELVDMKKSDAVEGDKKTDNDNESNTTGESSP